MNDNAALHWLALAIRAAAQPDNPVALVALLRSDLFGFSDSDLFDFKQAGGKFHYVSKRSSALRRAYPCFDDMFSRLKTYAAHFNDKPLVVALQAIVDDLGLFAWCSVQPDSNHLAGGLSKLIEVVRARQHEWTSISDLLAFLQSLESGDEAFDGMEAQPPRDPGVQVMNLHKVKGLEAPVVFLADPNGQSKHQPSVHISRDQDRVTGFFVVDEPSPFGFQSVTLAHPLQWEQLADTEQGFLDAEFHRLLYVAATRAKHKMLISKRAKRATSNPWNDLLTNAPEYCENESEEIMRSPEEAAQALPPAIAPSSILLWQPLTQPTYRVQSAKDLLASPTPPNVSFSNQSHNESALQWGNYIHALLRMHIQYPGMYLETASQQLRETTEIDEEMAQKGVALLRSITGSPVLERAKNAMQFFTEIPFQVKRLTEPESELPVYFRGVIDLVFQEKNGWVIVDYKTDKITPKTMQQKFDYYLPQINAYAEEWSRIVNAPVVEQGIYFIHLNQYVAASKTNAPSRHE